MSTFRKLNTVRVHLAGVIGHGAWQIGEADDRDAVLDDFLAWLGESARTAGLRGEIDDDEPDASFAPVPP